MNISKKTRKLVIVGLLTAITFLLGLTPLGFIPMPPPALQLTLLCIPVIIGVLLEGLGVGLWLGFLFGVTSFIQVFIGMNGTGLFLLNISVVRTLIVIFIPRLLVPVVAFYVYKVITLFNNKITDKAGYAIAAFFGSVTNTVFFLGMMYLLFIPELAQLAEALDTTANGVIVVLGSFVVTNGIPEAIVAVIIVSAVCIAVTVVKPRKIEK